MRSSSALCSAAARAGGTKIVELPWPAAPGWTATPGYLPIDAPAQLLIDNQLDDTHAAHLHRTWYRPSWFSRQPRFISLLARNACRAEETILHGIDSCNRWK